MYFRVLYNSLLGEMIDIRGGIRCIYSSPNSSRYCRNLIRPDIVLVLVRVRVREFPILTRGFTRLRVIAHWFLYSVQYRV